MLSNWPWKLDIPELASDGSWNSPVSVWTFGRLNSRRVVTAAQRLRERERLLLPPSLSQLAAATRDGSEQIQ